MLRTCLAGEPLVDPQTSPREDPPDVPSPTYRELLDNPLVADKACDRQRRLGSAPSRKPPDRLETEEPTPPTLPTKCEMRSTKVAFDQFDTCCIDNRGSHHIRAPFGQRTTRVVLVSSKLGTGSAKIGLEVFHQTLAGFVQTLVGFVQTWWSSANIWPVSTKLAPQFDHFCCVWSTLDRVRLGRKSGKIRRRWSNPARVG